MCLEDLMSRDPRKLRVFALADALVIRIYQASNDFPRDERYGLQSQIRRSAVSVPCNIVEGSARSGQRQYVQFLNIALGSAYEARYLVGLCSRLSLLQVSLCTELTAEYDELCQKLQSLINRLGEQPGR
jgi:four helix bundle protein